MAKSTRDEIRARAAKLTKEQMNQLSRLATGPELNAVKAKLKTIDLNNEELKLSLIELVYEREVGTHDVSFEDFAGMKLGTPPEVAPRQVVHSPEPVDGSDPKAMPRLRQE
jgi:hypothetical protein